MAAIRAKSGIREQSIRAVVTRKDGRVEDLGTIAYWSSNPLKHWAWRAGRALRQLFSRR